MTYIQRELIVHFLFIFESWSWVWIRSRNQEPVNEHILKPKHSNMNFVWCLP